MLQKLPGFDELWGFVPEETRLRLLSEAFADMPGVLTGRVDMAARLDQALARLGLPEVDADAVRDVEPAGADLLRPDGRTRQGPPGCAVRGCGEPGRAILDCDEPRHALRDPRHRRLAGRSSQAKHLIAEHWTVPPQVLPDVAARRRGRPPRKSQPDNHDGATFPTHNPQRLHQATSTNEPLDKPIPHRESAEDLRDPAGPGLLLLRVVQPEQVLVAG